MGEGEGEGEGKVERDLSVAVFERRVQQFGVEGVVVAIGDRLTRFHHLMEQHEGLDPSGDGTHVDHLEQAV